MAGAAAEAKRIAEHLEKLSEKIAERCESGEDDARDGLSKAPEADFGAVELPARRSEEEAKRRWLARLEAPAASACSGACSYDTT